MSGGSAILIVIGIRIKTNGKPQEEAVLNFASKIDILEEWIILGSSLIPSQAVLGIMSNRLPVPKIWFGGLDGFDEGLVKVHLADVADSAAYKSPVWQDTCVIGGHDVDMTSAPSVVAGEDGVKLNNAVAVRLLNTAAEGGINAPLSLRRNTRVDSSRVRVPDIN